MEEQLQIIFKPSSIVLIGSGTYACVFKITTPTDTFVVKYSKQDIYNDTSLLLEWVINSRFTHVNFIKITECRRINDHVILVMPYIGPSIATHMLDNTLIVDDDWARQLREMVTVLRLYNIAHKDISLRNILVDHANNSRVVLCDFGLANHNNPYDIWLETSLPVKTDSLTTLDADCVEFIITQLAAHAKKNKSTCRQLPRRTDANDPPVQTTISYVWSMHNINAMARLTGYTADFINTFLSYTMSDKHTLARCATVVDAIIAHPRDIYDNTHRLFS